MTYKNSNQNKLILIPILTIVLMIASIYVPPFIHSPSPLEGFFIERSKAETATPNNQPGQNNNQQSMNTSFVITMLETANSMDVNGISVPYSTGVNLTPMIVDERVLVPAQALINLLGGTSEWIPEQQKLTATLNGTSMEFIMGGRLYLKNGEGVFADAPSRLEQNNPFIHLKIITDITNPKIEWKRDEKKIILTFSNWPIAMKEAQKFFENTALRDELLKMPTIVNYIQKLY